MFWRFFKSLRSTPGPCIAMAQASRTHPQIFTSRVQLCFEIRWPLWEANMSQNLGYSRPTSPKKLVARPHGYNCLRAQNSASFKQDFGGKNSKMGWVCWNMKSSWHWNVKWLLFKQKRSTTCMKSTPKSRYNAQNFPLLYRVKAHIMGFHLTPLLHRKRVGKWFSTSSRNDIYIALSEPIFGELQNRVYVTKHPRCCSVLEVRSWPVRWCAQIGENGPHCVFRSLRPMLYIYIIGRFCEVLLRVPANPLKDSIKNAMIYIYIIGAERVKLA